MKGVKGVSGNPGGRPKLELSIRELAQRDSMEALETLVHVMRTGRRGEQVVAVGPGQVRQPGQVVVGDRLVGAPRPAVATATSLTSLLLPELPDPR